MFCSKCGKQLADGARFCDGCGTPIGSVRKTKPTKGPNIGAVIMAAVFGASAFLPYLSVTIFGSSSSVDLFNNGKGDGVFILALAAIALIFALCGLNLIVVIIGISGVGLAIFEAVNFNNLLEKQYQYAQFIRKDFGFYLMFVGAIGILVAGIVDNERKNKAIKESYTPINWNYGSSPQTYTPVNRNYNSSSTQNTNSFNLYADSNASPANTNEKIIYWRCAKCGLTNESNVSVCRCGQAKGNNSTL